MVQIRNHKSLIINQKRGVWIGAVFLIVAGFATYWNSLPAPFTFDDEHAIVINEQIRHLSTSMSPTEPGSPLAGRPLVSLTFAVNYALGGLDVRGYRLVNIAIHVLCALLLFALLAHVEEARTPWIRAASPKGPPRAGSDAAGTSTVRGAILAFAIALIWMVHPLVSEAVNYVSQRTELMMGAFFLLTLYAAQRAEAYSSKAWLTMSVACCAMGMACKETMAVAPIAVFLYDRTFVFDSAGDALGRRWRYYAALCATWAVLVALLWSAPRGDSAGFAAASVSPWTYLLNESSMIVRYLHLAIWPDSLVLDYGEPLQLTLSDVAPYAIAILALLALTIAALVRRSAAGFLGAWFFLTLAPTSSVIPISTEVGAERRMYLPLMALVALGVAGAARALQVSRPQVADRKGPRRPGSIEAGATGTLQVRQAAAMACTLFLAAALAVMTIHRNAEYLSGLTLWESVLHRWPSHPRAERNLAAELKLAGRRDEEITHLAIAAAGLPELRSLLGVELLSLGRNDEAAVELQRYVRDHPRDADALSTLGSALSALGRNDEAGHAFEQAVAADPVNPLSQLNLALHLFQQNDFDGAVMHARAAIRVKPGDPAAHNLLGLALVGQGKIDEALAEFRASLALQPNDNDATGYLERTLKAAGR